MLQSTHLGSWDEALVVFWISMCWLVVEDSCSSGEDATEEWESWLPTWLKPPLPLVAFLRPIFIFAFTAHPVSFSCMCSSNIALLNELPIFISNQEYSKSWEEKSGVELVVKGLTYLSNNSIERQSTVTAQKLHQYPVYRGKDCFNFNKYMGHGFVILCLIRNKSP